MLGIETNGGAGLDTVAHIIQLALTPVFLLSGIGTLLNVFSTRLARVADRVDAVAKALKDAEAEEAKALERQLTHLRLRSHALDVAVVVGGIGGASTCAAVLTMFVGEVRDATVATMLFAFFGVAVVCTIGALAAFTVEMLMASIGLRTKVAENTQSEAEKEAAEAEEPPQTGETAVTSTTSDTT